MATWKPIGNTGKKRVKVTKELIKVASRIWVLAYLLLTVTYLWSVVIFTSLLTIHNLTKVIVQIKININFHPFVLWEIGERCLISFSRWKWFVDALLLLQIRYLYIHCAYPSMFHEMTVFNILHAVLNVYLFSTKILFSIQNICQNLITMQNNVKNWKLSVQAIIKKNKKNNKMIQKSQYSSYRIVLRWTVDH